MSTRRSLIGQLLFALALGLPFPAAGQDREPRRIVRTICWLPEGSMRCKAFQAGLQDPSRAVRGEIVLLMATLGYVEAAANCGVREEMLHDLLQPGRPAEVRWAAALMVGQFARDGAALGTAVRLLAEADERIRRQAVEDIGSMADNYEFFADELAALATHPDVEVRRAVAQAYRKLGKSPPSALVAERLSAPVRADLPMRVARSRIDETEALRLWSRLAQSGTAPEDALRRLDEVFLLTDSPEAAARRRAAARWLQRVPPSERARLRAHFYVWSAGQWKVPG